MKFAKLSFTILLVLGLVACNDDHDSSGNNGSNDTPVVTPPAPTPTDPSEEVPQPKIYIDETFDQLSALPAGWIAPKANAGKVYIENGSLFIDGRANDTQMTSVILPEELQKLRDYRIDIEFSYPEKNNATRWGSIMYRAADALSEPAFTPYYQFAIRAEATGASGVELALRQPTNAWNVLQKGAYKENIEGDRTYKATVVVSGNRVRHYLDNNLIHDTTLPYNLNQGGIGLSTAGLLMRVDSIRVTQQLDALPESNKVTPIAEQSLPVSMAPTLIQPASTQGVISNAVSQVYYQLDDQLNILDTSNKKITSLKDYLSDPKRNTMPLFSIKNESTIEHLKVFSDSVDIADITLSSDNVELLRKARISLPTVRTALDYSKQLNLTNSVKDIVTITHNTNTALAKIIILPEQLVNDITVSHLQRLLLTPWAYSTTTDPVKAARILTSGVNGIIATSPDVFQNIMKSMKPNTLLRKPLITGHRGIPALDDENTLEGALKAVEVGADAVENDIYLTTDGHIVIMHDGSAKRTTGVDRNIEDMTLAEVRQLRTLGYNRTVPTLEEFLDAVKPHKNVMHFIEIKSSKPEIVPALKALLDKHDVYDQVVVISFNGPQLLKMKNILPGVSTGFLTNTPTAESDIVNTRRILDATQQYSSTFNPSYNGLSNNLMNMAKDRGVTFWPWTFRTNKADFNRMYIAGTHGLTTDYAHDASDFVVKLKVPAQVNASIGKPVSIKGEKITQKGQVSNITFSQMLLLPTSGKYSQNAQGQLSFSEKGTAYVMPSYTYNIDTTSQYTIYAPPVQVNVQ